MNNKLVIIAGPTAVGKTKISIELAKRINGEIISADSMQVYRGMDIGTAKIMPHEMQGIKHHLIDILEPSDAFNVVSFAESAKAAVLDIQSRDRIPIVVGGTGFYIRALLYDTDFTENDEDMSYRESLYKLVDEKGPEYIHDMLKMIDPESAEAIHPNNIKRVVRALEFFKKSNQKISDHNNEERRKASPYDFHYFALTNTRETLYENIDKRVDKMITDGLVEEVKRLIASGVPRTNVSMQGLGYKEIVAYLLNEISLDDAIYILKRNTRHFAKRQLTWLKREEAVEWFDKSIMSEDKILEQMIKSLGI